MIDGRLAVTNEDQGWEIGQEKLVGDLDGKTLKGE